MAIDSRIDIAAALATREKPTRDNARRAIMIRLYKGLAVLESAAKVALEGDRRAHHPKVVFPFVGRGRTDCFQGRKLPK